jgi:hypothetical protein
MATAIAATNPTLMDFAKVTEPDGGITTDLVEMLKQDNPILEDATVMEANGGMYHRSSVRTGMPEPTWRMFYQGVLPTKSTYAQVDEPIGMMEARSQVDMDLADMSSNPNQFRLLEAAGHIVGMNQAMIESLLYGAVSTSPQKFNGIMPRYSSKSTTVATSENIIDAGGTGSDNASILVVNWSPRSVFLVFPKGTQAGLQRTDLGTNHHATPPDGSSGEFSAYEEKFTWKCGLVVRDWRHIVRIANIDVSNLTEQSNPAAILELLAVAVDKLPSTGGGSRTVIYVNRTISTMLRIQTMKQSNVLVTPGREEGMQKRSFDDIQIRKLDQLLNTETRVT